jgi:hypothetical protein
MTSLLPLVQIPRDVVQGTWSRKGDELSLTESQGFAMCELPYEPPDEYDFEVEFTPTSDGNNVNLHLRAGGAAFMWKLHAYRKTPPVYGFDLYDGARQAPGVSTVNPLALEIGRRYTTRVEVRRTGLRGFVNGVEFVAWTGDFKKFSTEESARLRNDRRLAIGSHGRSVLFHRADVRAVGAASVTPTTVPKHTATNATTGDPTFAGHHYRLVAGNMTWTDSKAKAEALGGHLVCINSAEENDWIRRTFVDPLEEGKMFWIGATNDVPDGQWRWVNGDAFTFTGWAADIIEGRRFNEKNSCSGFCRNLIQGIGWSVWSPIATTGRNIGFLVERDSAGGASAPPADTFTFGGHRYQFVRSNASWSEAKAKAEALGGHLATITSAEEHAWFMQTIAPLSKHVWLGGRRQAEDGSWAWITGEPWKFTAWARHADGTMEPVKPAPGTPLENILEFGYYPPTFAAPGWNDEQDRVRTHPDAGYLVEWDDLRSAPAR